MKQTHSSNCDLILQHLSALHLLQLFRILPNRGHDFDLFVCLFLGEF